MNILEIIGNKLSAVAVWIARLREPETPYAAAKPSPNPIMNPITEFSEKIPIFFFNAFVSARLFKNEKHATLKLIKESQDVSIQSIPS